MAKETVNMETGEINGDAEVEAREARKAGLQAELNMLKAQEPPLIDMRDGIAAGAGALLGAAVTLLIENVL